MWQKTDPQSTHRGAAIKHGHDPLPSDWRDSLYISLFLSLSLLLLKKPSIFKCFFVVVDWTSSIFVRRVACVSIRCARLFYFLRHYFTSSINCRDTQYPYIYFPNHIYIQNVVNKQPSIATDKCRRERRLHALRHAQNEPEVQGWRILSIATIFISRRAQRRRRRRRSALAVRSGLWAANLSERQRSGRSQMHLPTGVGKRPEVWRTVARVGGHDVVFGSVARDPVERDGFQGVRTMLLGGPKAIARGSLLEGAYYEAVDFDQGATFAAFGFGWKWAE